LDEYDLDEDDLDEDDLDEYDFDEYEILNFDGYESLASEILKRRPTRPITVFINMPAIEKAFSEPEVSIALSFIPQKILTDDEDGEQHASSTPC
jgi:hypothetical protein